MDEQLQGLGLQATFVDGIHGESLKSLSKLEELCPDVLDVLELSEALRKTLGRVAGEMAPEQRRVLGCLLGHVRLQARARREGAATPVLLEDNVRIHRSAFHRWHKGPHQPSPHLGYLGYLGFDDNMAQIRALQQRFAEEHASATGSSWIELPMWERQADGHSAASSSLGELCFGAYALQCSAELASALREFIRDQLRAWSEGQQGGNRLLRKKRRGRRSVLTLTPVDKLLPRLARTCSGSAAGAVGVLSTGPVAFRMPSCSTCTLKSTIHQQYDAKYFRSTTMQLKSFGYDWSDLWLTADEAEACTQNTNEEQLGTSGDGAQDQERSGEE